jgi:hypothetical protein
MLHRKINCLFLILIISWTGCIEPYYPKEIAESPDLFVVSGQVTDVGGFHQVTVNKTSPLSKIMRVPIKGCKVRIIDSDNNIFNSTSQGLDGNYPVWIGQEYLKPGKAFKVVVITPNTIAIESQFDTLRPNPDVSDVYYQKVEKPTVNPDFNETGFQFKIDLSAGQQFGRFYKWGVEETYEYRAQYPIQAYWYRGFNMNEMPDYSKFYCWKTNPIQAVYTISTKGLTENKVKGFNFHYINNRNERLFVLYSLNVTQYAISEAYYNYLEQVRSNLTEQGGLFDKQPNVIKGNLYSQSHPDTRILGFFSAASAKSKRFFYNNFEGLLINTDDCIPYEILPTVFGNLGLNEILYLIELPSGRMGSASAPCFDCRLKGGTTTKPDFWPN